MASTYSALKIQLMATGENSGTWGNVTNVNLGTALEEAIVGSENVTFSSANVTLTLTDTNASQTARNLRLNLTGTTGGARDLIVPAIEKLYIVNNGCADTVTIKVTGQTGIPVPTGKTLFVYNNGTDCVNAITHLTSLTLASALPIGSGGTGVTAAATNGQLLIGNGSGFTLASVTGTSNQIVVTNGSGSITLSTPQAINTASSVQFGSFGVGTAASGTTGEIRATNNVTAFYSDKRLKEIAGPINNALNKVSKISGVYYTQNKLAESYGYNNYEQQVGVIAQEIKEVLPEAVKFAPFDREVKDGKEVSKSGEEYLTVQYEKLVPLLIEAIKELSEKVEKLGG